MLRLVLLAVSMLLAFTARVLRPALQVLLLLFEDGISLPLFSLSGPCRVEQIVK